jgi:hypothetical protein
MRNRVLYDTPNDDGESLRQYYQRFNWPCPSVEPPRTGIRLLTLFGAVSRLRRSGNNGPEPLDPLVVEAWLRLTRRGVLVEELEIIFEIDAVYIASWRLVAERERRILDNKLKPGNQQREYK